MAERSKNKSGKSFSSHVKEKEKPKTVSRTRKAPVKAVIRVRSNYSGRRFVEGTNTKQRYMWVGYGSEVDVLVEDIGDWVNLRMGGGCCGGQSITYFEIVGG